MISDSAASGRRCQHQYLERTSQDLLTRSIFVIKLGLILQSGDLGRSSLHRQGH